MARARSARILLLLRVRVAKKAPVWACGVSVVSIEEIGSIVDFWGNVKRERLRFDEEWNPAGVARLCYG